MSFEQNGYFTVTGGNIMRKNGIYRVSVYSHGYEKEETLEIQVVSSDEEHKTVKSVTLSGTKMHNVDFELDNIPDGDYNLNVTSLDGEHFDETRGIHLNLKKFSIFIQTDKSVYKPSDIVKFRVLVLDAETKPFKFDSIEIFITDGGENRVKQFEHVSKNFIKGVYQNELQLSDSPVMGAWKIHVKVNGEEGAVKSFDVDEYVLPKFEVLIDATPDVTFKEGIIKATVKANYTFGKIAKGNATVTAEVESPYHGRCFGFSTAIEPAEKVSKTVEVDGKKFVEFDIKKELGIKDQRNEHTVILKATFTDDLSGKEATATAKVKIHVNAYKLELKKSAEKFKPGLPFSVTAILTSHNKNMPVSDEKNPVKFMVTSYYDILRRIKASQQEIVCGRPIRPGEDYECWEESSRTQEFKILAVNGIAKIDIDLPKETTYFTVKAKYLNVEEDIYRIQKVESMSRQYIQMHISNERPNINEYLLVDVLSTNDITELTYQIIGSGRVLESKHETFEATKKHVLEIRPTVFMLPKSNIIVYYITSDGEIISDKKEVEFGNQLMNFVNLQLSTEKAKPGEDVTISVESRPNSFVGLLGVDQSVLLLKKGNDIEQDSVFEDLKKYGEVDKYNYSYCGGQDYGDFSDILMITNAKMAQEQRIHTYNCSFRPQARMMAMSARMEPMAMVMADEVPEMAVGQLFGGGPGMAKMAPARKPVEIRKTFPETWLFDNLEFDPDTEAKEINKKVPDTITSWIITGFSLDSVSGLGLTKHPTKLNVFQPFFVATNLPYSVKRGEVVSIPIIVYNYLGSDQTTSVTLLNTSEDFEFVDGDEDDEKLFKKMKRDTESERSTQIILKSDEGMTVPFLIRPLKAGQITIKIIAESQMAGDGVERQLKVEPEGVTQYLNEAVLIDLRTEKEFKKSIEIVVPQEAVPESTRIEASAIGDILGPSIENLDKLIKLPYGCGEQNMLNFVPNIVVLDYLTNLKKLNPQIESKAKKYMETGYQRELTYKHDDGSYSAFGKSDNSGSTWLTAFVAKSFNQAAKYIKIDPHIILTALNFLKSVQAKDGSFPEVGNVCHRDMQGGSSKGIALTAYTLITFLENKSLSKKFEDVTQKALDYILSNLENLNDIYSSAIASYALQLAGHEQKNSLLIELNKKSTNKDGMKYWAKNIEDSKNEKEPSFWHMPSSVNVEMSAYALQAFIEADQDNEAVPIMKWLVSQRNENGGFQSTQDTVVGLQALSKLATKIYVADSDLQISVKSEQSNAATININSGNSMILQKHELSSNARHFEVTATGKGFSILQISYKYNLDNSGRNPRFKLTPKVDFTSNKEFLMLRVTTSFIPDSQTIKSNMAVMEVSLPSGFTYDTDQLSDLLATTNVKKVETKDGDTVIMVYFDDIGTEEICAEFKAYRTHAVAKQKPAPVIIYDYYDNSRCARSFYDPPEISISDIVAA